MACQCDACLAYEAESGVEHAPTVNETIFPTGGKRSSVKPFYSAIPFQSLERLAMRATGAPKGDSPATLNVGYTIFEYSGGSRGYGYGNWCKGLPLQDTFNHVIEHLYRWKDAVEKGELPRDDDLAAAAWGIMMPLMTFERRYVERDPKLVLDDEPERKEQ